MIGRAAQGRPWIFREVAEFLRTGSLPAPPSVGELRAILGEHLLAHYAFYGEFIGIRTARKHLGWYVQGLPRGERFRAQMNLLQTSAEQLESVDAYLASLGSDSACLPDLNEQERLAA